MNVVALYGGQRYDVQLRALRQGPQVVVGTPGRLLDHLNRGTLDLSKLKGLVLDEADEMLRMGFIEVRSQQNTRLHYFLRRCQKLSVVLHVAL